MRASLVAVISLVSAVLGGVAVLAVGSAAGWIGAADRVVTVATPAAAPRIVERASPPGTGVAQSRPRPLAGNGFDPAEIYKRRSAGVVLVDAYVGDPDSGVAGRAQGSGFVASDDGYILTNSHVITETDGDSPASPAGHVYVEFADRERVPARIVGWDPFNDVGVLRVNPRDHPLSPVPLGDSSDVVVGEPVAAIGSPFGNRNSLAVGVVSATGRSIASLTSDYDVLDAIQTDAPINHGNSGGPLFNARGEVIGINAQIRSESGNAEGVGFAIPINSARRSLEQLVTRGRVSYPYVGIRTEDVTARRARRLGYPPVRGAMIASVEDGGPADRAGLRGGSAERFLDGLPWRTGGDLIVAVNGDPVMSADDLVRKLAERFAPGDVAAFTVLRGKDRRTVHVRFGERPAESG